jgi:hypothetical protein
MKPIRFYPLVSTLAVACALGLAIAPRAHAADNILHDMAIEFIVDEFVPTLLALAAAALREPMTWGVIGAAVVAALLRRARAGRLGVPEGQPGAASTRSINAGGCKA